MDSRGYGSTNGLPRCSRRLTGGLVLGGLLGVCVGVYGLLDGSTPRYLGAPMLLAGFALSRVGLRVSGQRVRRTRYRPDPLAGRRSGSSSGAGVRPMRGQLPRRHRRRRPALALALPADLAAAAAARRARRAGRRGAGLRDTQAARTQARPWRWPPDDPLRGRHRHVRRRDRARAARRQPAHPRGRAVPGRRPYRVGQVDPARGDQRAGAALHRRPPVRPRTRRRPRHAHVSRRASSPTSSAWSVRTRWLASSPTPSRRSSPTPWSSRACLPTSCASGSRRPSTCSGIADLRARALRSLSGGQQQRVAIGSVLTAHPRVLVLDEPTSALDPTAAEEVLAAITRLVHDLGTTVVVAEHRMERVVQYADRVVLRRRDRLGAVGDAWRGPGRLGGRAAGRRARPAGRLVAAAAVGAGRPPGRGAVAYPAGRAWSPESLHRPPTAAGRAVGARA